MILNMSDTSDAHLVGFVRADFGERTARRSTAYDVCGEPRLVQTLLSWTARVNDV